MGRISVGHSHPRPCSGKKALKKCTNNKDTVNVILIDDSENLDNVIIIDVPDSLPKKFRRPSMLRKDRKWSFKNVIDIDDDETPDDQLSGVGVNKNRFCADASSSRNSYPATRNSTSTGDAAAADCQFGKENVTPVRLSKCKRTYSGKASTRNHHGLDTDSESDASDDDDDPDCDLMEDSSGKVQEQWEKAFFRRKKDMNNCDAGINVSTSQGINENQDQHFETAGETRNAKIGQFSSSTEKVGIGDRAPSSSMKLDADFGCSYEFQDPMDDDFSLDSPVRAHLCHMKYNNAWPRSDSQTKDYPFVHTKLNKQQDHEPGTSRRHMEDTQDNPASEIPLQEEDKDDHCQNVDDLPSAQICIFNEREKLKETDEYKRAVEEEWASRQQALQIQAEEAHRLRRLRKRRKAESMRVMDMEKRQKERLEELRISKKQDEENMNLKEAIRAEVRMELQKLEVSCQNMASLLHCLGIQIGGWPNPLPQEVQTAYKKALLTFHPDRASRSDIRQQVEAEEKFKLVNRSKEKFSPSL